MTQQNRRPGAAPPPTSRPGAAAPPQQARPGAAAPTRQAPPTHAPAPAVAGVDWNSPEMTAGLTERGEESYREREGQSFRGIINSSLAKNIPMAKISGGKQPQTYCLAIIPYLCGRLEPKVATGKMKAGAPTHTTGVYAHRNIGPNKERWICLARTFGKPCPVCEERERLDISPDANEEQVKALLSGKYMTFLYYGWDRDNEQKGVQLYEISGFFFERHVQALAKPRAGGYIPFASPSARLGKDITFSVAGSSTQQNWYGHKFEDRNADIPQWVLDQAASYGPLDELLAIPRDDQGNPDFQQAYDDLYDAFWAGMQAPPEQQQEGYAQPGGQGEQIDPSYQQCYKMGQCGAFGDCQTCPYYDGCAQGGMVPGSPGVPAGVPVEDDIPFEQQAQEHQPPPGPAQAPPPEPSAAAPPRTAAATAPPVGAGGKPPLLRRGQG